MENSIAVPQKIKHRNTMLSSDFACRYGDGLVTKSCLTLATPWTVACQAPLSMEFSWQEYWSGLLFHSAGDLPDSGIEPGFPEQQENSLLTEL